MSRNEWYRTMDGNDYFYFRFEQPGAGAGYRIYVERSPSYGSRPTDGHSTHRYTAPSGEPYVCWTGTISTLQDARKVAKAWAESTQAYIRTGRTF